MNVPQEASGAFPCPVGEAARACPGRLALTFAGARWTWAQVEVETARWALQLATLGVVPGDPVALLSYNRPEFLFALWGAARVGAWVIPLNARLTGPELQPLLERISPRLVLVDPPLAGTLSATRAPVRSLEAPLPALPETHSTDTPVWWRRHGPLLGLFTSGTTGRPKLALHGVTQLEAASRASAARLGGPGATWLGTLPLFHVGGLAMAFRVLFDRGTLALAARFDPLEASAAFDSQGITHASLVPTTLARLLDAREGRAFPEAVRVALIGGGPMSASLLLRARALGLPCLQTYGMTEACSQITTELLEGADASTAGPPLDGTEVRIVDDAGRTLGAGDEGRIEVRGSTLFQGYFDDPKATDQSLHDGWFVTGDLGVLDEKGRLRLLSRRTDLIVRGGENVYPAELEHVIAAHPDVEEAAVVGLPDVTWGQVPVALIVPRRPVSDDALDEWVRERLARYKRPARWVAVEGLPRNAMGKVERARLLGLVVAG